MLKQTNTTSKASTTKNFCHTYVVF